MNDAVLACVPNFAEGRDSAVVDMLLRAMQLPGVLLLDCFRNAEANRTIVTIAGPPVAVCEAATRAAAVAVERIDIARHRGTHPRMGSLDVLPFVPVRGLHVAECASLARETALVLWEQLRLPAYLYAAAATRPDRVELSVVRQGQFEGIRDAVRTDPLRRPDVGGPGLHPTAGAVAVGARPPLVEFRLTLQGDLLNHGRAVARALRERMPQVEATASLCRDAGGEATTEILVKIPNHRQHSITAVCGTAEEETMRRGQPLLHARLTGLIPEEAFEEGAAWVELFERGGAGAAGQGPRMDSCILERRLSRPLSWPRA